MLYAQHKYHENLVVLVILIFVLYRLPAPVLDPERSIFRRTFIISKNVNFFRMFNP